jgi:hypothetical protein
VRVTINGHTYRSTVAVYNGVFMLPLSAENREAAAVVAGDEVEAEIALDSEPREVAVPDDFAAALDGDAAAKRVFAELSYSQQRWFVLGIEEAKASRPSNDASRRRSHNYDRASPRTDPASGSAAPRRGGVVHAANRRQKGGASSPPFCIRDIYCGLDVTGKPPLRPVPLGAGTSRRRRTPTRGCGHRSGR